MVDTRPATGRGWDETLPDPRILTPRRSSGIVVVPACSPVPVSSLLSNVFVCPLSVSTSRHRSGLEAFPCPRLCYAASFLLLTTLLLHFGISF